MLWRDRWLTTLIAFLIRHSIGLGSYSGAGIPPKYGDFEAQRHWMEVTVNLPTSQWYQNSTMNDLSYWGLDYPPLSGYQSWLHGKLIQRFEPDSMELLTSHGYENATLKLLMRWSVILSDLLIFIPGALLMGRVLGEECFGVLLLQPCLMLIDHGHFQYNGISLGFALLAVGCIMKGHHRVGSALYVCAFHHKHMSLYYATAFFAHLLGHCLHQPSLLHKLIKFCGLGATVVLTMVLIWWPYLDSLQSMLQVVHRLTPVDRGLYEDYVSNFWCVSSVVIKWKRLMGRGMLVKLCTVLTLMACVPSMVHQMRWPSHRGFPYSLVNTSLAFYLFSYQVRAVHGREAAEQLCLQVHEKSILMPALVICLLIKQESWLLPCFHLMAAFSLFPLLEKDGLTLQYLAVLLICQGLPSSAPGAYPAWKEHLHGVLWVLCGVLHSFRLFLGVPGSYPFLHDLLFSGFSFFFFLFCFVYLNLRQWGLHL